MTLVVLVVFFSKRNNIPSGESFYISDTVLTNTRQVQMTSTGDTVFFTGSNIAKISKLSSSNPESTTSLLNETPYTEPGKAIYDEQSDGLLVSVLYTGDDYFFNLGKQKPGVYWLYNKKNQSPRLINPNLNQTIDATIHNGTVYGLTVEKDSKYNLYTYDTSSRQSKILAEDILSNSFIGASESSIITREKNGTVVVYSKNGETIAKNKLIGSVIYDKTTARYINIDDDISRKSYKLTVYDALTGKKIGTKKVPYRYAYVASGEIFLVNKKTRPTNFIKLSQEKLKPVGHNLDLGKTRSEDSITSIVLVQEDPLVYGVVGSSNSIYYLSNDGDFIKKIPEFKSLVIQSGKVGTTEILSFPGLPSVSLRTPEQNVKTSIADLRQYCGCDINQLAKSWLRPYVTQELE